MDERRGSARPKSFMRGCIYFNQRRNSVDCLIREMSAEGARLFFSAEAQIPDVVELYIPHKQQTLRVHKQWRRGEEMGVAFAAPGEAAVPERAGADELAIRVGKLEDEIATLKRIVRRLREKANDTDIDLA